MGPVRKFAIVLVSDTPAQWVDLKQASRRGEVNAKLHDYFTLKSTYFDSSKFYKGLACIKMLN